jgi:hypothetical protein
MDQGLKLKTVLSDSLNYFLIKELTFIIFGYLTEHNIGKIDKTIVDLDSKTLLGIAINNNVIFVSEPTKSHIIVYDKKTNEKLYTFGSPGAVYDYYMNKFKVPMCRVDYVPYNQKVNTLDGIKFFGLNGLTIDDNILYVIDHYNYRVQMFKINDKTVSFYNCFGEQGIVEGQFLSLRDIIIFGDEIYINDIDAHRIKIYNKKTFQFIHSFRPKTGEYAPYPAFIPMSFSVNENFIVVLNTDIRSIQMFDKKNYSVIKEYNYDNMVNDSYNILLYDNELYVLDKPNNKICVLDIRSLTVNRIIHNSVLENMFKIAIYDDEIYVLNNNCIEILKIFL